MRTNLFLSLTVALLLAAAPSFAQADLRVTVPFDFHAGKRVLPSGTYLIDIETTGLVKLDCQEDVRARIWVGSIPIGGGSKFDHGSKLVFHRYGDTYFLAEAWMASSATGRKFKPTRRETETARNNTRREVVLLAANVP